MKRATVPVSFGDMVAIADERIRPICVRLRKLIVSVHEDVFEVTWPKHRIVSFGVGPKKMTEHYAYIGVQTSHVNLGFYHGAVLPDPEGLLEGTDSFARVR